MGAGSSWPEGRAAVQWHWWESHARCLLRDLLFAINKAADVLSNAVNLLGVLSALSAVCLRW